MIEKKFVSFTRTQAGHRIPVATRLVWDPDAPLTLQADFVDPTTGGTVTWHFSRDLLIQGFDSPTHVGTGDVKVRRSASKVILCLSGTGGHIDMVLPYDQVSEFLEAANEVCEPGSDEEADLLSDSLDRLIAEVYEEGDRA